MAILFLGFSTNHWIVSANFFGSFKGTTKPVLFGNIASLQPGTFVVTIALPAAPASKSDLGNPSR